MSTGTLADNTIFNRVFDPESDTLMVSTNPGSSSAPLIKYKEEPIVNASNLPSGSAYYPSSEGALLGSYRSMSLVGSISCPTGSAAVKVEVTNDENLAAANWYQVFGYNAVNNQTLSAMTASAGISNFVWYFDDLNTRAYRVKVEIGNSVNTISIMSRKTT